MLSIEEKKYWIWISRLPRVGSKTIRKLLDKYDILENIYKLSKEELVANGISQKLADILTNLKYKQNLDKYLDYMEKNKIELITIKDKKYPTKLKCIDDYPMYLFARGNFKLLNKKTLAVVGTRNCTNYGKKIAKQMGTSLVQNDIVVVSGLAKGIDTYAHIGALKREESTIAVLGCAIDKVYPKENEELANEIIQKNGLIISEYVMGSELERLNFPARNRIVSGISDGVLVIEAPEKSGALITVDFALEQGKDVFAIPGNINSIFSKGTNKLIKDGAKLVDNIEDILL